MSKHMTARETLVALLVILLVLGVPAALTGTLWILAVVVGVVLVLAVPVALIPRLFPAEAKRQQDADEVKARQRERLAEYGRAGLQIGSRFGRGKVISGQHAGVRFEHHVVPADKHTPARVVVSIPMSAPGEFEVRAETGGTALVKRLGMVEEFEIGDAAFDGKYYFSGTSDEYVRAVFAVRENLARLRTLFTGGFDDLEKSDQHLVVSKQGAELLAITELKFIVAELANFKLPPVVPGAQEKRFAAKQVLYALRGAGLVLVLLGVTGYNTISPLLDGGWTGFAVGAVALYAAMLAGAYFGLRGRSMAARGLIEMLLAAPLLIPALVCTLALANEEFDGAEAQQHEARLITHFVTTRKRDASYHFEFESWRGRGREHLRVSDDIYALARAGQIWQLRVSPGWLGQMWVESMEPLRE